MEFKIFIGRPIDYFNKNQRIANEQKKAATST